MILSKLHAHGWGGRQGEACAAAFHVLRFLLWKASAEIQEGVVGKAADPAPKNLAVNRQAQHLYHLLERFESGVELTGTEVKSIREGKITEHWGMGDIAGVLMQLRG